MDFKKYIPEIEKIIRYKFKDKSLLTQAFTRTSYCNEHNRGRSAPLSSNEVLEFFGDSVLSTAIVSLLMMSNTKRFEHGISTELREGDFSAIRSKLSDKSNLSKMTAALGLQKYLLVGEGDAKLGIENEPSVMEDLFESIIGAIYIDCGMNISVVTEVVARLLDVEEYSKKSEAPVQSHKNALQEWCADKKHRLPAPVYKTLSESGPDHKKTYERGCYIGERLCGRGVGKNQKLADAAAAAAALELLLSEDRRASASAVEALTKIKEFATKNKLASAQFRDLGETEKSTVSAREYAIECRFAGKSACGTGPSKQDARAKAAEAVLTQIEKEKAAANAPSPKKKPAQKKKGATEKAVTPKIKSAQGGAKKRPSTAPKRTPAHHKKFS
ncbi:MAG: hypothetical protein IJW03_05775 [Clostridia bacterium]|nr:hypothetical protein [Clostridia bacterium]